MSQALQNEVKRLRLEVADLKFEIARNRELLADLRLYVADNYQRKRGPKPSAPATPFATEEAQDELKRETHQI